MSEAFRTAIDLDGDQPLAGKTVLVRVDLSDGIDPAAAQTIRGFLQDGARVAILSGFEAPAGDVNPALSLARFRQPLEDAVGAPVAFISDCVGPVAEAGLHQVPFGEVALMENLRFHPDDRRDSRAFALRLSVLGDCFSITGEVPDQPVRWLIELALLLPTPSALARRET